MQLSRRRHPATAIPVQVGQLLSGVVPIWPFILAVEDDDLIAVAVGLAMFAQVHLVACPRVAREVGVQRYVDWLVAVPLRVEMQSDLPKRGTEGEEQRVSLGQKE